MRYLKVVVIVVALALILDIGDAWWRRRRRRRRAPVCVRRPVNHHHHHTYHKVSCKCGDGSEGDFIFKEPIEEKDIPEALEAALLQEDSNSQVPDSRRATCHCGDGSKGQIILESLKDEDISDDV